MPDRNCQDEPGTGHQRCSICEGKLTLLVWGSIYIRFQHLKSIPTMKKYNTYNGLRPLTNRYSNEAEKAFQDIYDVLKLKK